MTYTSEDPGWQLGKLVEQQRGRSPIGGDGTREPARSPQIELAMVVAPLTVDVDPSTCDRSHRAGVGHDVG